MPNSIDDFKKYGKVYENEFSSVYAETNLRTAKNKIRKATGRTTAEIAADLERKSRNKKPRNHTPTGYNRYQVLRDAGFKCLACGASASDTKLEIDHIKPKSTHPHLRDDPDNFQVLCESCNRAKGNKFTDDLR